MPYDIIGAKKAGIPDDQIAQELSSHYQYDYENARKSGISDQEIIGEILSKSDVGTGESLASKIKGVVKGAAEKVVGNVEGALHAASKLTTEQLGNALSGFAGLGTLVAQGGDQEALNKAAEVVKKGQELTAKYGVVYPGTETGKSISDSFDSAVSTVMNPNNAVAGLMGLKDIATGGGLTSATDVIRSYEKKPIGERVAEAGYPNLGAGIDVALQSLPYVLPFAKPVAKAVKGAVENAVKKGDAKLEFKDNQPVVEPAKPEVKIGVHYSKVEGLKEIDPAKFGSGMAGAEVKRAKNDPANWVPRSYYYAEGNPMKENGLGPHKYTTEFTNLYDYAKDPDGLAAQSIDFGQFSPTLYEKKIKEAGYEGYHVNNPQLGEVIAAFDKKPVKSYENDSIPKPLEMKDSIAFSTSKSDATPEVNKASIAAAEAELKAAGVPYRKVNGVYDGVPEESFVVPNSAEAVKVVTKLADEFKQDSVLHVDAKGKGRLLYGDGRIEELPGKIKEISKEETQGMYAYTHDPLTDKYYSNVEDPKPTMTPERAKATADAYLAARMPELKNLTDAGQYAEALNGFMKDRDFVEKTLLAQAEKDRLATQERSKTTPESTNGSEPILPQGEPALAGSGTTLEASVIPGAKQFAEGDVIPAMKKARELVEKSIDSLKKTFAPASRTPDAAATSYNLRDLGAQRQQALDQIDMAIEPARVYFDKVGGKGTDLNSRSFQFIKNTELGRIEDLPVAERPFANLSYQLLDHLLNEVQKRGRLQDVSSTKAKQNLRAVAEEKFKINETEDNFISYYFPRLWKDPAKAQAVMAELVSKRPFEGAKGFLKERTIKLYEDGIRAGLEPAFDNPMDMLFHKAAEITKWNMSQDFMALEKDAGRIKFVAAGKKAPEGWKPLDDRISTVYGRSEANEIVIRGRYYAPEASAQVFNNLISDGLGSNALYRSYRGLANGMNQFQLGLSFFHAGFTSMDAMVSSVALGLEKITHGDFKSGVKDVLAFPATPLTNALMGRKMNQVWFEPGKHGPAVDALLEAWKMGGGRARMDSFYRTQITKNAMTAWRKGNPWGGLFRLPGILVEQSVRPVLEFLVPWQKMGIGAKMLEYEIRRNPNMTYPELQKKAAEIVDSVDNRMGQLAYDNLFWNKTAKDLGLASVRSLGWNIGTWRELGGAVLDTAKQVVGKKELQLTHRQAYAVALPVVVGLAGALYQYLSTDLLPGQKKDGTFGSIGDSMKDLYYPRTGGDDEQGRPDRVVLPSYMKDLYHYYEDPKQTLLNKIHPALSVTAEMLQNKDFYNVEIRHPDDPVFQQGLQEMQYAVLSMLPFSIRNYKRQGELGMPDSQRAMSFVGITPASPSISETEAEKVAAKIRAESLPKGARTKEAFEASKLALKLRKSLRAGDPDADQKIQDAFDHSGISKKQLLDIYHNQGESPLVRMTRGFTVEQMQKVLDVATPEEKAELETPMAKKQGSYIRNWPNKNQGTEGD